MKTIKLFTLLSVLLCATTTWAQTSVSTDDALRAAIQNNGANITVTADIDLSNSTLSIESGKTITIDLNGHTLDRRLNSRGEGGGQVITVRSGAKLYLSNGTLKGGWGGNAGGLANEGGTANLTDVVITGCKGDDRGGGICNLGGTLTMTGGSITNNTCYDHGDPAGGGGMFNAEGATATLMNVTITGNEDMVCGGGGICNYGTILLDGCTITGNKARTVGGGIWSTNKNGFKMQGSNIITDNIAGGVPSNIFLKAHCLITLTSSITGSRIGVMLDVAPYWFVDGFATYHSGEDPNTFFTCDKPWVDSLAIIQPEPYVLHVGEVIMRRKNLKGKVPYIEHSWDSENNKVLSTTKILTEEIGLDETPTNETQYKKLKSSNLFVTLGTKNSELHEYYVAEGDELNIKALDIEGPNVHIILRDSSRFHLDQDIGVETGNTVYFHAQSTGSFMGKLTSGGGIGGAIVDDGANIEIHGGNFDLQGAESCAAIGGKYKTNGNITIYDGHIKATGGDAAAGIGSGYGCENYGNITIYGGKIEATGSAGIGGGQECLNGKLTIWDGAITARGQSEAAGIGGSQYGSDYAAGTITINGGYIRAYGATHGAGIGGGDDKRGGTLIVNGGRVDAYGGTDAAGIGGGEGGNGGIVTINGGYVYAEGNDYGAGIGGGQGGTGANVTITGGVVIAKAGRNETGWRAIGPGSGSDNYGQLTIGDEMMVSSERMALAVERHDMCWYRTQVRVEPCTHQNATYTVSGTTATDTHTEHCMYCATPFEPELHHFEDETCTVCHVSGSISSVSVYLPDIDEEGHYIDGVYRDTAVVYHMVTNSTFDFPPAPQDPQGMDFAGWRDGDTLGLNTFIADDGESLHSVGSSFTVSEDVSFTSRFHKVNLFSTAGNWNEAGNWYWNEIPNGSDVVIGADAIIPDNYTATADSIAIDGGTITIADGGQLIHSNVGVTATMQKEITSWTDVRDNYYLMALPFASYTAANSPLVVNAPGKYDLYTFDGSQSYEEWRWHPEALANGQGFLYADSLPGMASRTLSLTGTLVPADTAISFDLAYDNTPFGAWNLVGNPFACNATSSIDNFYVIGDTELVPASGTVAPLQGIFVMSTGSGQSVTFTPGISSKAVQALNIRISKAGSRDTGIIDRARIRFEGGEGLEKFMLNPSHTKIYIPQGGKDYAVVNIGRDVSGNVSTTEIPLNFETQENGTYTISVNPENVKMNYLHLIDIMAGADVDLLAHAVPELVEGQAWDGASTGSATSYTFTAKTTDNNSRFRLVFVAKGDDGSSTGSETFAFISNGNIIVNDEGMLQVIDVTGRVIVSRDGACTVSTSGIPAGVYVLRLINGNDVKVQKIVVR